MQKTSGKNIVNIILPVVVLAALFTLLICGPGNAAAGPPEVRVGSELEFPPYAFVDEQGEPAGFSVDLIRAVADAMGLSIRISTGPWDTVWNDLVAGRLDVLPVVARLPERTLLVDFSLPHTETFDAFFVRREDDPIQDIKAARGKEIVVMRSDAAHHALLERSFQGKLILVNTIPEGLSLISSGKHDAFLCSKLIGTLAIRDHGIRGLAAGPPIPDYKRVFSFAVKKGDAELLEKLNQGLMIIKTNGVYERLYEKWLSVDDPWKILEKYFAPAVAAVITIALIAGIWLVMLQRMVGKRTRELAETNIKLRQAREELEERVNQRTIELTQANKALQTEIAERKRAEERTKHLASFPHLNPNPVMETDSSGKITYYNFAIQKTLKDLGFDKNEVHVFLPEDFNDILRKLKKEPESVFQREVCIKDRVFSSTVHHAPQFDVVRMYSFDITGRKKAEAEIIRAKEEWELTFNSVPDLIAILDREYRFVRVNRAMAEIMETTADECIGLKCFACVHGTSGPPAVCPHKLSMEDGREHRAEVHEDRFKRDFLVTTTPLFNESGQLMGSVHVARDITERKQAEGALRQSETQLKRSQEIAHLGSWELDLVNNVLTWSDEVYRIFGLLPQEFPATYEAFLEAVHPDDRSAVDEAYSGSLREGKDSYEIVHRIVKKSTGEIRHVHEKCEHTRDESGRIIRSVGMVHDITGQKHAEEEREKLLEELKRSNKELEQFAYIASHDLQEPLRMMSSYIELISRRYRDRLDDNADEFIGYIVDGAAHMQTLLNDLLAYSRVGSRMGPLQPVDLNSELDRAIMNLRTVINETHAEITREGLPTVPADRMQMVQILQNIIANAMKFRSKETPRIHVFADQDEKEWTIRVRDNGIGIDPRYYDKLFVIFKRLHSREEYPGTGIGLAVCKKIAEHHGGRIWVESEPGKGSTFCFTIAKKGAAAPGFYEREKQ